MIGDKVVAGRLSKAQRREQLLDAAEEIVVRTRSAAVTMEAVAAQAGVSKALPYAHFANADVLLLSLYRREVTRLALRLEREMEEGAQPGEEQLRRVIHAVFDVLSERGILLSILVRSSIPERADGGNRVGPRYMASLLRRTLGLEVDHSIVLGTIVFASLSGAVESYARRDARRAVIEERVFRYVVAGSRAVADLAV
ncbi:MAG: TetR/AcrR family transcriptional regulator [Acidimicrobiales bacterium]|jgi:AcrR family transcriptional regulator